MVVVVVVAVAVVVVVGGVRERMWPAGVEMEEAAVEDARPMSRIRRRLLVLVLVLVLVWTGA